MRGVPAHPERLRDQQRRPLAPATALGRESGRRVGVEHVVAVELRAVDAIARGPLVKLTREVMAVERRPQGHLVVLEDEDGGQPADGGEVGPFVRRRRVGGAVADPGEGDARLPSHAERERDAGDDRHHVADVRDRLQHAAIPCADVQVAAAGGRGVAAQIAPQHVGHRHAQLAARGGVADHRGHDVAPALQGVDGADGDGLFARAQPRFRDHARAHPALQLDVVQAGAQQPRVQGHQDLGGEAGDDGGALGIALERLAEGAHQPGVRLPRDVLGRIERREPPYFSFSLIFDRKPPSWNVDRASANSSAVA